jgi:N6-adenosine-specific RNA methylase IME4
VNLNRAILRKLPRALRIEIEENAQRKALTQSELAFEQRRILAELRKHKKPGSRTDLKGGKETCGKALPEVHATSIVGRLYGESRTQIEKRLAVVQAAEREPEQFGHLVAEMDRTGKVNAAHRELRRVEDEKRILGLTPVIGKFRTLIIDPPWKYDMDFVGRGRPDYACMTQAELLELPVKSWAEENCHLYLWTTNAMFPQANELREKYGFRHNTVLTWAKPKYGMGTHFRGQTEHVIFGIRGSLAARRNDLSTLFEAPVGKHSEKPERFYEIVRAASYPPYGEAFQRQARPGFSNLFAQGAARKPARAEAAE